MASESKSERLLNLLIMLLVQRRYVSKDRIRGILYPDSTADAFDYVIAVNYNRAAGRTHNSRISRPVT